MAIGWWSLPTTIIWLSVIEKSEERNCRNNVIGLPHPQSSQCCHRSNVKYISLFWEKLMSPAKTFCSGRAKFGQNKLGEVQHFYDVTLPLAWCRYVCRLSNHFYSYMKVLNIFSLPGFPKLPGWEYARRVWKSLSSIVESLIRFLVLKRLFPDNRMGHLRAEKKLK